MLQNDSHHTNTPKYEWPGKSNHINTNHSHASQARNPPQITNMDRLYSVSHSAFTNAFTKYNSASPIRSDGQSPNCHYPDVANHLSRSRMPVDATPAASVTTQLAMRLMLLQQPKYRNYFVAPEKLQPAWRAVLLSRHATNRYSALPADSAAATASANLLTSKFERREADQLSAVLKRLRKVGKPHSVPSLSTLLNTFIHAACLTNASDRDTLHRAHTADWVAYAEQLHMTVQNLLASKMHVSICSDITVSDLLDAYAALYHLHFPKNYSAQLNVAVNRICSSLDQIAIALLDKMTTSDALQLADWTLFNSCYSTSNFNHHFINRWFSALEGFSPSTKHITRHVAIPSAEECLRVMFHLATMHVTAPVNLMAVLERLIIGRDIRWNSTTNMTDCTKLFEAEQQAGYPNSLDAMSDAEFAVMCYSFFRTKSYFHNLRTFARVLQRAERYVQELPGRAASSSADRNCDDAELVPEQQLTDEISRFSKIGQQNEIAATAAESVILDSILKCVLMHANHHSAEIVEPFTSMVRRALTAVVNTRSDQHKNDFLQSVFDIPLLARVAAITSNIGLRDEVLLDLVFKRIVAICRLRPECIRIKYLALLLEAYATLTYVPNECSNSNSHDEEQFFSFLEKQISGLVSEGRGRRDLEIMRRPELLAQAVWHLATFGYYSPTMIKSLFALSNQRDISWRGPNSESDGFDSFNSSSGQRQQPANETGLAVLRWCIMLERPNFDWRNISVKSTNTAADAADELMQYDGKRASRFLSQSLQDDAEDDEVVDSSSSLTLLSEIPRTGWLQRVQQPRDSIARRKLNDFLCYSINQTMWPSSENHAANVVAVARLLRLTPYADQSVVIRVDRASGKPLPFDERVANMFSTAVNAGDLLQQQQQLSLPTDMNVNLLDDNRHVQHIALIIRPRRHYFESISDRSRHLVGDWRMQERHLRLMGFRPVSIDRYKVRSFQQEKNCAGMTALIRDTIRSIIISDGF